MDDFDLRAVARQVVDDDTSEDFSQIVKAVREAVTDGLVAIALDQALPAFVHTVIRAGSQPPAPSGSGGGGGLTRSPKRDGLRESWQRRLDAERYTVADGSIRRIGDMSREDVAFVAAKLEALAAQNAMQAQVFRALESAMPDDSARVRDLPGDTLRELLG